mmetsp:Transcript_127304/g.220309  ORF Transcript_127304/g.220309 Transcript_127304/m.220309 type:complete len:203 (-) Transcript_127304:1302-1910(-)
MVLRMIIDPTIGRPHPITATQTTISMDLVTWDVTAHTDRHLLTHKNQEGRPRISTAPPRTLPKLLPGITVHLHLHPTPLPVHTVHQRPSHSQPTLHPHSQPTLHLNTASPNTVNHTAVHLPTTRSRPLGTLSTTMLVYPNTLQHLRTAHQRMSIRPLLQLPTWLLPDPPCLATVHLSRVTLLQLHPWNSMHLQGMRPLVMAP